MIIFISDPIHSPFRLGGLCLVYSIEIISILLNNIQNHSSEFVQWKKGFSLFIVIFNEGYPK